MQQPRALAAARDTFIAAMKRETSGSELTRLVAVLDALIKWSLARPQILAFQTDETKSVIGFRLVKSNTMFWAARVMRGDAPKLEIYPPTGRPLTAEMRAKVVETLNANSRDQSANERGLRIGFGALKNGPALEAVLAQLDELTRHTPAVASAPASSGATAVAAAS